MLEDKVVDERSFPDWSMGFERIEEEEISPLTIEAVRKKLTKTEVSSDPGDLIKSMMQAFINK